MPKRETNRTKFSRMEQVKFFKGCRPQILVGPFLNTLAQIILPNNLRSKHSKVMNFWPVYVILQEGPLKKKTFPQKII